MTFREVLANALRKLQLSFLTTNCIEVSMGDNYRSHGIGKPCRHKQNLHLLVVKLKRNVIRNVFQTKKAKRKNWASSLWLIQEFTKNNERFLKKVAFISIRKVWLKFLCIFLCIFFGVLCFGLHEFSNLF